MANKHLSYRQFKNIFGDLGVTAWTKYNWLSNGLPDGNYNGITKVTITEIPQSATLDTNSIWWSFPTAIVPESSNEVWKYGFSNYEIKSAGSLYSGSGYGISISSGGALRIRFDCPLTIEAYNEYLKQNPIILYYYDNRQWGGLTLNGNEDWLVWIESEHTFFFGAHITVDITVKAHSTGIYNFIGRIGSSADFKNLECAFNFYAGSDLSNGNFSLKDNSVNSVEELKAKFRANNYVLVYSLVNQAMAMSIEPSEEI